MQHRARYEKLYANWSNYAAQFYATSSCIEFLYLYLLDLYPGFDSYTERAAWKILDLITEALLI